MNLRLLAQLGVEHFVYYDMHGMPTSLADLRIEQARVKRCGLSLTVIEGGPPIDKIVLGLADRDEQIEIYKRALGTMGKLGIRTLCYNFMPQVTADAMVIRTSYNTPERGGALTSAFKLAQFDQKRHTKEGPTSDEQMWDNLEYFLRRIIPACRGRRCTARNAPRRPATIPDVDFVPHHE